jgi:hypothetical protein
VKASLDVSIRGTKAAATIPSNVIAIGSSIGAKPLAPAPAGWTVRFALDDSVFAEIPTIRFLLILFDCLVA